jgi:flagellar export protein FliJ
MAFQFSLATVLRIRGLVEEQEERMLQRILLEIARSNEALAVTDASIAKANASRCADIFKPFLGHNLHAFYGEVKELKENKKNIEEQIEKLKLLRDKQIGIYEKARQNREMLSDMREERRNEHESDIARLEQKTLDDIFISRRGRN